MFCLLAYLLWATQRCLFMSLRSAVVKVQGAAGLLAGQGMDGLCVFRCFLNALLGQSVGKTGGGEGLPQYVGLLVRFAACWTDIRLRELVVMGVARSLRWLGPGGRSGVGGGHRAGGSTGVVEATVRIKVLRGLLSIGGEFRCHCGIGKLCCGGCAVDSVVLNLSRRGIYARPDPGRRISCSRTETGTGLCLGWIRVGF